MNRSSACEVTNASRSSSVTEGVPAWAVVVCTGGCIGGKSALGGFGAELDTGGDVVGCGFAAAVVEGRLGAGGRVRMLRVGCTGAAAGACADVLLGERVTVTAACAAAVPVTRGNVTGGCAWCLSGSAAAPCSVSDTLAEDWLAARVGRSR